MTTLSPDTESRIQAWMSIASANCADLASLEGWIDDLINSKNISSVTILLPIWFLFGVDLPLDQHVFQRKTIELSGSDKLPLLKESLVQFFRKVLTRCKPRDVYTAVFEVFLQIKAIDVTSQPSTPTKSQIADRSGSTSLTTAENLQNHWTGEYIGPSRDILLERIQEYEKKYEQAPSVEYYSKSLLFAQSSGTGKSRLADSLGEICPMVSYVIRDDPNGFPPPDNEILAFMKSCPSSADKNSMSPNKKVGQEYTDPSERVSNIWFHALAIGILQASFEVYDNYISSWKASLEIPDHSTLAQVASITHEKMAVRYGQRRSFREGFCQKVAERAPEIVTACIKEKQFHACFDETSGSIIRSALNMNKVTAMNKLRSAVSKLEGTLSQFHRNHTEHPGFILVFNEVSSLLDNEEEDGRYIALNRLISCISKGHNFWYLFLSTEIKLNDLLPPDFAPRNMPAPSRPSYRGDFQLKRYPPFTEFTVDIPDIKNNLQLYPENESMSAFALPKHMASFGRPLWLAYDRPQQLAAVKIIGGNPKGSFNANDPDQVFAALSVRLCIDMNLANPRTLPLSRTAVNAFMRMVDSVDPSTGVMFTTTPSEPILADAAMRHLCKGSMNWLIAISTFTAELLDRGAIDKGRKGELYSRLILTLAHDSLAGRNTVDMSFNTVYPTFTVEEFLKALYARSYHTAINQIDADILRARMNFLSFTSTEEYLTSDSFQRLCYMLLRRSAALQLAPQQKSYDHLLPFYTGDPDQPFDLTKIGAILVQVKNRKDGSMPSSVLKEDFFSVDGPKVFEGIRKPFQRRDFSHIIFDNPETKLLFLLLDFGLDVASVDVSYSKATNPRIWAVHSRGYDERLFGCINTMNVGDYIHGFFHSAVSCSRAGHIAVNHHRDQLHNALYYDRCPTTEMCT